MEFENRQAIYLQIGDFICENILSGKWKAGAKIPAVREMAVNVQVNPNTVMRAYAYLQEKGIIQNQRGIGYFVDEASQKNALALKKNEFITEELPKLFKNILMIGITFEELIRYLEQYKNQMAEEHKI